MSRSTIAVCHHAFQRDAAHGGDQDCKGACQGIGMDLEASWMCSIVSTVLSINYITVAR